MKKNYTTKYIKNLSLKGKITVKSKNTFRSGKEALNKFRNLMIKVKNKIIDSAVTSKDVIIDNSIKASEKIKTGIEIANEYRKNKSEEIKNNVSNSIEKTKENFEKTFGEDLDKAVNERDEKELEKLDKIKVSYNEIKKDENLENNEEKKDLLNAHRKDFYDLTQKRINRNGRGLGVFAISKVMLNTMKENGKNKWSNFKNDLNDKFTEFKESYENKKIEKEENKKKKNEEKERQLLESKKLLLESKMFEMQKELAEINVKLNPKESEIFKNFEDEKQNAVDNYVNGPVR